MRARRRARPCLPTPTHTPTRKRLHASSSHAATATPPAAEASATVAGSSISNTVYVVSPRRSTPWCRASPWPPRCATRAPEARAETRPRRLQVTGFKRSGTSLMMRCDHPQHRLAPTATGSTRQPAQVPPVALALALSRAGLPTGRFACSCLTSVPGIEPHYDPAYEEYLRADYPGAVPAPCTRCGAFWRL